MYVFTDSLFKSLTVFIDDSSTQSSVCSHLECVRAALVRYREMRLILNPDKTFLGVHKEISLIYVVSENSREPDPDKITVIDECLPLPMPKV